MQWYEYDVTQMFGAQGNYGGHSGIDIGTPPHTPLFFPVGGKIIDAGYYPWGGQVGLATPDGKIYAFLHTDDIYVKEGQVVKPGQIVANSGGGIGNKLLLNGKLTKAQDQSDYGNYSTGYHTHFSVFSGSTKEELNRSLGANIARLDPTNILQALRAGKPIPSGPAPGGTPPSSNDEGIGPLNLPLGEWGARAGIFLLAAIFTIFGLYLLFQTEINAAAKTAIKAIV